MTQFSLSINDILKDAQRINEYRGDDTFALTSFLREVDTVFLLVQSQPDAKEYIYQRIILNKLQGEALHVIRTLGTNASWEETKEALISNFGVKETYHQLYQEAFAEKNHGIINYYKHLRNILCKINEKFEYDREKPLEFSPAYAEKIILKTFLSNIDVNLASVIINKNIFRLRDAYNLLEKEGLIRSEIEKAKPNKIQYKENHRTSLGVDNNKNQFSYNRNNGNYEGNNTSRQNSQFYTNQNRGNNNNFSKNYSQMPNSGNHNSRYNNSQNDRRTYQSRNDRQNFGQNRSSQMEIDHFEERDNDYDYDEQVNFHTTASSRHFQ